MKFPLLNRSGQYVGDGDAQFRESPFPSPELHAMKVANLADIIRRVVANPANVDEVAEEIATDWFPVCKISGSGEVSFVLGSGKKK